MSRPIKNIFNTVFIGIMSLLISSAFTMTAFALSPGEVGIWASTTPLPVGLAYTNSVIYNGYVYKIGGSTGLEEINTVYSAPLNSNGTLGNWSTTTPLPQNLSNSTSVVYNGYVYVIGGTINDSSRLNTVYSAPLNLNGTVGDWTASTNTLPQTLNATTSIVYNDYVYVMGGFNGSPLNTVYSAQLNNGTVGTWATSTNTLPQGLDFASAITYDGYAYIMGGLGSINTYSDNIYSAPLGANGTIGAWSTSPNKLPRALFGHTTVTYNGYTYVMGGYTGGEESDAVYSAPLGANGTIGAWSTTPNKLPRALWAASSVTANGFVYYIGGTSGEFFSDVYYAELTDYLPPASPSQPTAVAAPNTGLEPTSYLPAATIVVAGISLIFVTRRRYS